MGTTQHASSGAGSPDEKPGDRMASLRTRLRLQSLGTIPSQGSLAWTVVISTIPPTSFPPLSPSARTRPAGPWPACAECSGVCSSLAPFRQFSPHDRGELFGGREFAFEIHGQVGLQLIDRDANGVLLGPQGVFDLHVVLFGTQDDADGRPVAFTAFLVVQQVQVKVHLAGKLRFERADLQLECHQRLDEPVVEEQVNEVFLLADRQPVLAGAELGESGSVSRNLYL